MKNISSQEAFELLQALLANAAPVVEVDRAISVVKSSKDVCGVSRLLSLLDDGAAYDESMFSIIHAAEDSDDLTYANAFVDSVPALVRQAPRWASIILMRILNNENSRRALVGVARSAPEDSRLSLTALCEAINERGVEFVGKTLPIIIAAKG